MGWFRSWSGKYERACCAAYVACVVRAMKPSGSVMLGQEVLTSPEEVPKNDARSPIPFPELRINHLSGFRYFGFSWHL